VFFFQAIESSVRMEKRIKIKVSGTSLAPGRFDSRLKVVYPSGMPPLARMSSAAAVLIAVLAFGSPSGKLTTGASTAEPSAHYETATLAAGCFWGLQESLRHIPGVIQTTVGYSGGTTPNPTYELVGTGKTGHAEAVRVIFDPARLSYEELLRRFFQNHDPTSPRQQTNGAKVSYRSAIFYHSEEQRQVAERVKEEISQSGKWNHPVVTEITPATEFYPAEAYHQDYLEKNSAAHTCRMVRD
jgi:peptide methionine sulfoxide reductase msrA/msrB